MRGEWEHQMAAILWQVPQQMCAAVCAAIYIVAKHRHTNICKSTPFFCSQSKWSTAQTDGIKHCGSLEPELCCILKERQKKEGGGVRKYVQQSRVFSERNLSYLRLMVSRSAKE